MLVPAAGSVVGNRYTLIQAIGRGGMGEVWQAHDRDLDSPCAIKFILPHLANDRGTRERFVREARAVARLSSPHVVHVLGVGEEDGILYLALQLLEGETLRSRLRRIGKLHPTLTLELTEQVSDALENARRAGIVHRDLKPENIWCWSGSKLFVKVLDFGVAKFTLNAHSLKTATGALLGTPQYMSPEQSLGSKDIDHRSDLWALALIVIECLTGKRAFDGPGLGNLLVEIASGRVPPLRELGPELPEGLGAWWARALARDPSDRFQSATELVDALRPHLAHPSAEWLAAQAAIQPAPDSVQGADAISSQQVHASSVPGGEPLAAPHVTVTYAPHEKEARAPGSTGLATSSPARLVSIDPGRDNLPAASLSGASHSTPISSPRRALGRRIVAAAGLSALAILALLASVRLFSGPREADTMATGAGAVTAPDVSGVPTGGDTSAGAHGRDVPTRISEGTGTTPPADAGNGHLVEPSTPGQPRPADEQSTERGPETATNALQPQPGSKAQRQAAAVEPPAQPHVEADASTDREADSPPVNSGGDKAGHDKARTRVVDDALGLGDDHRDDTRDTSARDKARTKRLKELERQLGLSPVRE